MYVKQQKTSILNLNRCETRQKKKELLLKTALYVTKLHPGKSPNYPNLEDDLFTWVCEKELMELPLLEN